MIGQRERRFGPGTAAGLREVAGAGRSRAARAGRVRAHRRRHTRGRRDRSSLHRSVRRHQQARAAALSIAVFARAAVAWLCMRNGRARLGAMIVVGMFWCVQTDPHLRSATADSSAARMCSRRCSPASRSARSAAWIVGGLGILALTVTMVLSILHIQLPLLFPAPYAARASFAHCGSARRTLGALCVHPSHGDARSAPPHTSSLERQAHRAGSAASGGRLRRSAASRSVRKLGIRRCDRRASLVATALSHPRPRPGHDGARVSVRSSSMCRPKSRNIVAAAFRSAYAPPYYISGEYRVYRAPGDLENDRRPHRGRAGERQRRQAPRHLGRHHGAATRRGIARARGSPWRVVSPVSRKWSRRSARRSPAICEHEQWEIGGYWRADEKAGELDARALVGASALRRCGETLIEDGKRNSYGSGVGLVGHAWRTGSALWIPDVTKDERVTRGKLLDAPGYAAPRSCR